jgi:hypothetical protein
MIKQKLLNIGNNIKQNKMEKIGISENTRLHFCIRNPFLFFFFLEIDKGNEPTSYIIMYHLKYLKTFFYKKKMCAEVKKRTLTEVAEIV